MKVPFVDLSRAHAELADEVENAVRRVMRSGWYVMGPEVEAFEAEFSQWIGTQRCVGTGNGLDAIELSLRALGIGGGHEVIVPSNTYIATWLGVSRCGAKVVPAEPDKRTYNVDPDAVEHAMSPKTRAILAVHLYGQAANMAALRAIADRRGVLLIEDAAQAHGATFAGRAVGGWGDVAAWSFYPTKNLGALGDGGAVTTNDPAVATRVAILRNYGARTRYTNDVRGINSRLDEVQAAILRIRLRHLKSWNERRKKVADRYRAELASAPVDLPFVMDEAEPVWHQFVVRSAQRDLLQRHLASSGISSLVHYPIPPHLQKAYRGYGWRVGSFPLAEQIASEVLSLPIGPHLGRDEHSAVIDAVRRFRA